jgi:hypothetical protein
MDSVLLTAAGFFCLTAIFFHRRDKKARTEVDRQRNLMDQFFRSAGPRHEVRWLRAYDGKYYMTTEVLTIVEHGYAVDYIALKVELKPGGGRYVTMTPHGADIQCACKVFEGHELADELAQTA